MNEEQTRELKVEATLEAEAEPETTPEPTKTVQELAELVKGCWESDEEGKEGKECKALGAEFDKTAKELNIPVGELIDSVFELAKKAK